MAGSRSSRIHRAEELQSIDTGTVRAKAAVGRLGAIHAQLSVASTYCEMAESELARNRVNEARQLLHRARRIGDSARRHLNQPNYVPSITMAETRDQLARLESRVLNVAAQLTDRGR